MNLSFLRDRSFLRELLVIAIPISFQQLINASLNMIDVIMVGQLGETAIAAIGLSNQVFFVLILVLFGATSGMAIFSAQYWGRQEIEPILRKKFAEEHYQKWMGGLKKRSNVRVFVRKRRDWQAAVSRDDRRPPRTPSSAHAAASSSIP